MSLSDLVRVSLFFYRTFCALEVHVPRRCIHAGFAMGSWTSLSMASLRMRGSKTGLDFSGILTCAVYTRVLLFPISLRSLKMAMNTLPRQTSIRLSLDQTRFVLPKQSFDGIREFKRTEPHSREPGGVSVESFRPRRVPRCDVCLHCVSHVLKDMPHVLKDMHLASHHGNPDSDLSYSW